MEKRQVETSLRSLLAGGLEITLGNAFDTFLHVGQVGKSAETTKWYRKKLASLVEKLGVDSPLVSVMEADLLDWLAELEGKSTRWGGGSTHPVQSGRLSAHTLRGHV